MPNVAVVGAQWGDEGKGKIVDWLSEKADVIIRFQGGHAIYLEGLTIRLVINRCLVNICRWLFIKITH